jgi:hypothetical protein
MAPNFGKKLRLSLGIEQRTFTCEECGVIEKCKDHLDAHPTHVIIERHVEVIRWGVKEHCTHPEDLLTHNMLSDHSKTPGENGSAYCKACACVLYLEGGAWVAQPTGITKVTMR